MHSPRSSPPAPSIGIRCVWLAAILLFGLIPGQAGAAEPGRSPSRFVPGRGLTSYVEFDGLDAHTDAWRATAAHQILGQTTAGATLTDVSRRILDQLFKAAGKDQLSAADWLAFQDHLVRRGFACALFEDDGESAAVLILNDFGGQEIRDRFDRILRPLLGIEANAPLPTLARRGRKLVGFSDWDAEEGKPEVAVPPPDLRQITALLQGNKPRQPPSGLTWWREGDALVMVKGPSADPLDGLIRPDRAGKNLKAIHRNRVLAVLDAIEVKTPNVTTLPSYTTATVQGRDLAGFEPTGLFFAEGKAGQGVLDALAEKLGPRGGKSDEFSFFQALDIGRAHRIVGRWGFRGSMLVTDLRFEVADAWRGPLIRGGFARDQMPPIPAQLGTLCPRDTRPEPDRGTAGPFERRPHP